MEKIQKASDKLHQLLTEALADEPNGKVTAAYLAIRNDLEALDDLYRQLQTDQTAEETKVVNQRIADDWNDPEVQVNPNAPHPAEEEPEPEPEEEAEPEAEPVEEALS